MDLLTSIIQKAGQWIFGTRVCGLEIQFLADGSHQYYVSQLVKGKNTISIEDTNETKDLDKALTLIRKKPVVVCLSGKGIICKRIEAGDEGSPEIHFPGIEWSTVNVKRYKMQDAEWLGLVKKETLNRGIQPLAERGIRVVGIELGGVSLLSNATLFAKPPARLGNHVFEWDHLHLGGYQFQEKEPAEQSYTQEQFYGKPLAFSMSILTAIDFFRNNLYSALSAENVLLKEFILFRLRTLASIGFAIGLLLVLLLNFFILQQCRENIVATEAELELLSAGAEQRKSQQLDALSNQNLYRELIGSTPISYTEILESLARAVPAHLTLTRLNIHPPSKKKQQAPVFQKNIIWLTGKARDLKDINVLIENLDKYTWINEIKLKELIHSDKTDEHHFELLVEI